MKSCKFSVALEQEFRGAVFLRAHGWNSRRVRDSALLIQHHLFLWFHGCSDQRDRDRGVDIPADRILGSALFWSTLREEKAAIGAILVNIALYPMPYILLLMDYWPPLGSWASLYIYSLFIVVEVVCGIIGGVLLDSMMADVVEDSELKTNRRSEGLFYAARGFAAKAISAGGIVGAGTIVSLVGLDGVTSVDDVTREIRTDLASLFLPLYCGLYIVGLVIVSRYRITRDDHEEHSQRSPSAR